MNTIAPIAASRMTETVMTEDMLKLLQPEFVAPLVAYLTHESCEENGGIFEVGAGYLGKVRYQRSAGVSFGTKQALTPERICERWADVCDFEAEGQEYPNSVRRSRASVPRRSCDDC